MLEGDEDDVTIATSGPMGEFLLAEYAITSLTVNAIILGKDC